MLGVFKRRWKPKRSSNVPRLPGTDTSLLDNDKSLSPPLQQQQPQQQQQQQQQPSSRVSSRQVYPVCDDKKSHLNGILLTTEMSPNDLIVGNSSPPPYPKRASLESNPSPTQCYPLAPNICVEAGRIQFIKQDTEGLDREHHQQQQQQLAESLPKPPATPLVCGRVTVTRGQQTEFGVINVEYFDDRTNILEQRIQELEIALETTQKNELRDKQTITKLQKHIARRESAQRDADRERRLRSDSESRAKQALQEASRCRSRLKLLTNEFVKMEETVRSMLVYKKQVEQLRQEKNTLTVAFENRCQQYQTTISRLNNEITTLRQQLAHVGSETSPEEILQAHTAALQRHAEESRKQYERCLDDVANQVVRALLAQKGLREEVGSLNNRIHELEQQNRALTSMLVHQLLGDSSSDAGTTPSKHSTPDEIDSSLIKTDTPSLTLPMGTHEDDNNDKTFKHCNSFNSGILEENSPNDKETVVTQFSHRLSLTSEILDTRLLSLEDKRRHQVLTKLWTELKGTEVTPKKLLEALSTVDSALLVPPQRPVSLNLHLPVLQTTKFRRARPILAQSNSKSEEETTTTTTTATTGNESPESGNRDEGYSTMSSDVQADLTRNGETVPNRGLEDLKEATDETDITTETTRLLITDNKDPDILYIPFNLLNIKSRNSYPPGKDMLPFQHIMRSFSDSHLCIKITTAPSPCYTFSSPVSSSPSIFLLDITEKKPLKRTRATSTLWANNNLEFYEDKNSSQFSWSSIGEDRLDCPNWDAEYIQQWLRLDETRSTLLQQQQQHRDMFELEYDHAELEDWSLSLSNDDLREQFKRMDAAITPGQISVSTLPSIQENNALELEEDSNECLWNNSSYMIDNDDYDDDDNNDDKQNSELVIFQNNNKSWPYAFTTTTTTTTATATNIEQQISPDNSWSSAGSDCCYSSHEPCSKRSSAALSGCSDDTGELPAIGTDFTRDFYRLVKFESTKSLASTSSRSLGGGLSENGDHRETTTTTTRTAVATVAAAAEATTTLHNVLTFIAEQQQYVNSCESHSSSMNDITKEFNIEGPPPQNVSDSDLCLLNKSETIKIDQDDENNCSVILSNSNNSNCSSSSTSSNSSKQSCDQYNNIFKEQNIAYANEVCLVTPLDVESENCSNISEHPVDICSSINVEITSTDYQTTILDDDIIIITDNNNHNVDDDNYCGGGELIKSSGDMTCSDASTYNCTSESLTTSSISTPETIISKIPRRKQNTTTTKTPSPSKKIETVSLVHETKIPKSKITHKKSKATTTTTSATTTTTTTAAKKERIVKIKQEPVQTQHHVITSERLPQCSSGVISNIIDGPPHRAVSFHERATSKDVIDELNRMIKNGDENIVVVNNNSSSINIEQENHINISRLDQNCRPTGWIHVEKDIDLADPKARANLLDVMMASVSSDSSPTSSCGGSVASDSTDDPPPDYGHLHRIHRFHRQKKAKAARPELAVVRASISSITRPTIIGRPDFFVRYGEKEMEAVASFDFLDEFSTTTTTTTSSSLSCCSIDESAEINHDDELLLKITTNSEMQQIQQMKVTRV